MEAYKASRSRMTQLDPAAEMSPSEVRANSRLGPLPSRRKVAVFPTSGPKKDRDCSVLKFNRVAGDVGVPI